MHIKVSIIIVTYNNLEKYTKKCFKSIIDSLPNLNEFEIIFIDNDSTDGTQNWLKQIQKKYPIVHVIFNNENAGFARANNQGITNSSGDYVVLLNNDTIVKKGWLEKLIEKFKIQNIGLLGPITNSITSLQEVVLPGINESNWSNLSEKYTERYRGQISEVRKVCFFCVVIPRYVINDIGLLDEHFGLGNFEDDDYCLRVIQKYKIFIAEDVYIWHFGSGSFSLVPHEKLSDLYERNKFYLTQKYNHIFLRAEQLDEIADFIKAVNQQNRLCDNRISVRSRYISHISHMIRLEAEFLLNKSNNLTFKYIIKKLDQLYLHGFLHKIYIRIFK